MEKGALSDSQAREVNRRIEQSVKLKATNETTLALAEKITPYSINKIMAMDDDELGLKAMSGEIDRPGSDELPADMTPPVQDPGTTKKLTDTDKSRLAEQIDERVTTILKEGSTDIDIFVGMANYMTDFKWFMDTCSPSDMHSLCARYDGFYRHGLHWRKSRKASRTATFVFPDEVATVRSKSIENAFAGERSRFGHSWNSVSCMGAHSRDVGHDRYQWNT